MFGVGPNGDNDGGGMGSDASVCFSKDGTVCTVIWEGLQQYVRGWNRSDTFHKYGESLIALTGGDEDEIATICPVGPGLSIPALKYQEISWGEGKIMAVALNYYSPSAWIVFVYDSTKGVSPYKELSNPSSPAFDNNFTILSDSPDEEGYFRFAYSPYTRDRKYYGYLGNGRITQAVFEKVGPFVNGKAEVVIQGIKKTITLEELNSYLSK